MFGDVLGAGEGDEVAVGGAILDSLWRLVGIHCNVEVGFSGCELKLRRLR